jgi:leucyl aminopeptidase
MASADAEGALVITDAVQAARRAAPPSGTFLPATLESTRAVGRAGTDSNPAMESS